MLLTPNQKHIASWLLIVLLAGIALWLLAPALSPFLVAAVLAYALNPLVNRIDDWFNGRMPRWLAAALVEGAFILLVGHVHADCAYCYQPSAHGSRPIA